MVSAVGKTTGRVVAAAWVVHRAADRAESAVDKAADMAMQVAGRVAGRIIVASTEEVDHHRSIHLPGVGLALSPEVAEAYPGLAALVAV
jgi:hypothetical protein